MKEPLLIGVDVGGTNLRVGVLSGLELVWSMRRHAGFSEICQTAAAPEALEAIIDTLVEAVDEARAHYPQIHSVGIGFPGFIAPNTRLLTLSPNLPGLLNVDLITPLKARLGLPVHLENDALAAAYGEYMLAQPQSGSLLYIGLGTGVGGGMIINGKPYSGEHGMAMELGHLIVDPGGRLCGCGNRGCLERYVSAGGITLNYEALERVTLEAQAIATLARQGECRAVDAFKQAATFLAMGLAHVLKIVDVAEVVIGGGLTGAWPLMEPVFLDHLEAALIPALRGRVRVRISEGEDRAGMLGAATLARIQANASGLALSE